MKSKWDALGLKINKSNRKKHKHVSLKNGPIYQWQDQSNVERLEKSLDREFAKQRKKS